MAELAVSAAHREQFERAARLFGAAEAEGNAIGTILQRPVPLPAYDAELVCARDGLGNEVFDTEVEAGRNMTIDEALSLALRGKGGRRRPSSGWESLTPAELEVVRLVSTGLTNPEIAERLLVTRGTVKVHVSHIFTKLGVRSRAELAADATRRVSDP